MKNDELLILAIDASTTSVGWALFEGEQHIDSGIYRPRGRNAWVRVENYYRWLASWYEPDRPYRPHIIAYEIASGVHGNPRTDRLLGGLEAYTRLVADMEARRFIPVNVQRVKATGCHKGALRVAEHIRGWAFDLSSGAARKRAGDVADALGIGLAALAMLKEERIRET